MDSILLGAALLLSFYTALLFILFTAKDDTSYNLLGSFLVLCASFEYIAILTADDNNFAYFHLFNVLTFIILALFFFNFLKLKRWFLFLILLVLLLLVINVLGSHGIHAYNMVNKIAIDIIVMIGAIASLFRIFATTERASYHLSIKYFIFGLLLKISGSFIIFLFFNLLSSISQTTMKNIFFLSISLNCIAQVLYIFSLIFFWKTSTKEVNV